MQCYLVKTFISEKILKNRTYETAINHKHNGCQRGLTSMVYKFFDKKTGSGASVNELAQKLRKAMIKKSKKR